MPIIGTPVSYSDVLCSRCNSKRRVSKTWTEKIKTDHSSTVIQHVQIVCTNKECQAKFDALLLEESKKREKLRVLKEENAANRKINIKISKKKLS